MQLPGGYESALRALVERDALEQLKYAWIRAADASDADRMVERFVEDCTVSYEPESGLIVGREALRTWNRNRLEQVTASSHHVSNFEVRFHGEDRATTYCYFHSWQHFADYPNTPDRQRYARYVDTWIRLDGAWWQESLTMLVAGEWNFSDVPRFGEYRGWDVDLHHH